MSDPPQGPAASPVIDDESSTSPRTLSFRERLVLGIVATVLLAIVAITGTADLSRGALKVAEEYFDALAAGDAETARSLLEQARPTHGTSPHYDVELMSDDVLAHATELVSDVDVRPADDSRDTTEQRVIVSYTLSGTRHTEEITMRRGGRAGGLTRPWRMPASIVPISTLRTDGSHALTIAGADISSGTTVRMFPAVYPVAAADPENFELEQETLEVSTRQPSSTTLGIGAVDGS